MSPWLGSRSDPQPSRERTTGPGLVGGTFVVPMASVHLLAATPSCHWLEYVDWAAPALAEPLRIVDSKVQVPEWPRSGASWGPDFVKQCRILWY